VKYKKEQIVIVTTISIKIITITKQSTAAETLGIFRVSGYQLLSNLGRISQ